MFEPDRVLYEYLFLLATFNLFYGLCSFYIKERLFISETLLATLIGILLGPKGLSIITVGWEEKISLWYHFARLVLAVQVMAAGIQLPSAYLKRHWPSLALLLGPVMVGSWITTSIFVFLFFSSLLNWKEAMLIGAILSPTDPVIASSIVKGKFAELHVPLQIRTLLSAESGANDGLALSFILLSIFLIYETQNIELHFFELVILRKIVLSIAIGLVLGYGARKALRAAEFRRLIDKESIVAFNFALAMMTLGLTALIDASDMLAVFVLGVEFSWDGWFEEKTGDTEFQAVIDALFTFTFFIMFGAITPWSIFSSLGYSKLIALSACILLFRRVPFTMLLSPWIPQLKTDREALFVGWFGPMGVGALFYAWFCDLQHLNPAIMYIVWFTVLSSILVHGATVPAFHIKTLRQTFSMIPDDEDEALEALTLLITDSRSSINLSLDPVFYEELEGDPIDPIPALPVPSGLAK